MHKAQAVNQPSKVLLPSLDNQELDDQGLDDAELLASLEAQEEVERMDPGPDSGYWTLSNTSTQSERSSSTRSLISTLSSRFVHETLEQNRTEYNTRQ